MIPATPTPLSATEARDLTDHINHAAGELWVLLMEAYNRKAWAALGYANWRDYATAEFNMSKSHAYRLLDQARVVTAIQEAAATDSPIGEINELTARTIKPNLPAVTEEIRTRVAQGEEPEVAVRAAVERASERTYTTKHGTTATMNVGGIREAAQVRRSPTPALDAVNDPAGKVTVHVQPTPTRLPPPEKSHARRIDTTDLQRLIDAALTVSACTDEEIAALHANDLMLAGLRRAAQVLDRVIQHHSPGAARASN